MHNLIIMVGPPGAGKSTYSSKIEGYLRVSQDEEGKFGHLEIFMNCLKAGESMIIDRMNFNKAQRKPYIEMAKKHGYKVELIVIEEVYGNVYYRCLDRKDHPTLNDEKSIKAALAQFYKEYERPEEGEADVLTFLNKDDRILETRNKMTLIQIFESYVSQGYLRKSEKGSLVLYGYTDKCTFDRNWNFHTRQARGIIIDRNTGKIVAKPFPKFFNLNEMEETRLVNLPNESYTVHEKLDGSLGIIFHHEGQWQISTRGSFYSDQAVKGAEIMKKYDLGCVPKEVTLLVEIIYPENKIVVNYGDEEKLVLLGGYNPITSTEIVGEYLKAYSVVTAMPMANTYTHTIEEMIALQKTIPKDDEGFVVRFASGLRVKIKGDEYMRIAKMISQMSPLSFWESMEHGVVKTEYLTQLPEEFRDEFEPIVKELEDQYTKMAIEIEMDLGELPVGDNEDVTSTEVRKRVGLFVQKSGKIKHGPAMFPLLFGKADLVDNYIMKNIRPKGNEIRKFE